MTCPETRLDKARAVASPSSTPGSATSTHSVTRRAGPVPSTEGKNPSGMLPRQSLAFHVLIFMHRNTRQGLLDSRDDAKEGVSEHSRDRSGWRGHCPIWTL